LTNTWKAPNTPSNTLVTAYVVAQGCHGGTAASVHSTSQTITTLNLGCKMDALNTDTSGTLVYNNISHLNVYPNPANGDFTIDLQTDNTTDMTNLRIINMLGQIVIEQIVPNNNGSVKSMLVKKQLPPGTYLIKAATGDNIHTTQIVIQ
jgi:hypothetical protein